MSPMVPESVAGCQDKPVSLVGEVEEKSLSLAQMLRAAIDESGCKRAAVAASVDVSESYFSLMLSGEKPIAARHIVALPREVAKAFARRYAQSFGLIVAEQPVSHESAAEHLIAGLFGLVASLPQRADHMAQATLGERVRKTA